MRGVGSEAPFLEALLVLSRATLPHAEGGESRAYSGRAGLPRYSSLTLADIRSPKLTSRLPALRPAPGLRRCEAGRRARRRREADQFALAAGRLPEATVDEHTRRMQGDGLAIREVLLVR
jgi:hypothetical protein